MLEHDMAAARLTQPERDWQPDADCECVYCHVEGAKRVIRSFTLANPEDLLTAMEVLMREHPYRLTGSSRGNNFCMFNWLEEIGLYATTLPEVVGLACIECVGGEE